MSGVADMRVKATVEQGPAWRVSLLWLVSKLPALLRIFVPTIAVLLLVQGRFLLGFDVQDSRCIPEGIVFLVDRADRDLQRGRLIAMASEGNLPWFSDGTVMIKTPRRASW